MHVHFRIAEDVAQKISETFPGCIELEFEKCYYPYLLYVDRGMSVSTLCLTRAPRLDHCRRYSKKRYAGLMFTSPDKADYVDVKGLQLVRRDNAKLVKTVSQAILDALMYDKSSEKAIEIARTFVLRMLTGELDMDQFIISKSLRGTYANPNSQPHVTVARKIRERTGEVLDSGARVPYVFVVDNEIDNKLISAHAEDPQYVKDSGLQLDYLYYLNNQLMSPVTALLEVVVDDPASSILAHPEIEAVLSKMREERASLLKTVKRVKTNTKNRQMEITKFFAK